MAQTVPAGEIRTVELAQGTMRYREAGSGDPLVFVHGLLVDGSPSAWPHRSQAPGWNGSKTPEPSSQ